MSAKYNDNTWRKAPPGKKTKKEKPSKLSHFLKSKGIRTKKGEDASGINGNSWALFSKILKALLPADSLNISGRFSIPTLLTKSRLRTFSKALAKHLQPPDSQVPTMTGALKGLASSPSQTDRQTGPLFSATRMASRDFGLE